MAGKRLRDNGSWEYVFKRAGLLPKPLYLTFDPEEEGDAFAKKLDALLKRGILPEDLKPTVRAASVREMVAAYLAEAHLSKADVAAC